MTATETMREPTAAEESACAARAALDAVRAFGIVFGGPVLLDLAAAASLVAAVRALRRRRRPSPAAALGIAATGVYAAIVVPWMDHWGAERGDRPVHAVTIDAPPEQVWPWLAQIGQDRGGFYSYAWLENLAGSRMRNANAIQREWQHREPGERVMLHPAVGVPVTRFEPGRAIALDGWGAFEVEPLPGGRTRLVARPDAPQGLARAFYELLVRIPHFVMERRMLLGIRQRAELGAAA